jgi:hypothetical protein
VGELKKGINPSSINLLNFDSKYLPTVIKAGLVTGLIALAVSTQFLPISTSFFGELSSKRGAYTCIYPSK